MADKFSPEIVNLIMHLVEALDENEERAVDKLLELLREKGYLDKEETPTTSVADESWWSEHCNAIPPRKKWMSEVYTMRQGERVKIAFVNSFSDTEKIAALPKLVKAARSTVHAFTKNVNAGLAVCDLIEALEKAGEIL